MSLWLSLNTAFTGLRATQAGVQLASQNVANAQTDGYTKKVATYNHLGFGGVSMPTISRQVNDALFRQSLLETTRLAQYDTADAYLNDIVSFLGTPASGGGRLATALSELAAAIDTVATVPNEVNNLMALRDNVVVVTDEFHALSQQIQDLRLRADQEIATALSEVNDAVTQVDLLNKEIGRLRAIGKGTGDIEDRRDLAIQKLAELMPVRTVSKGDGTVSVYMSDGRILVDATSRSFVEYDAAGIVVANDEWQMQSGSATAGAFGAIALSDHPDEDSTWRFTEGRLGQLLRLRDGELPQMQSQLDSLAAKLRDEVNRIHNQGAVLPTTPPQTDLVGNRWFGSSTDWAAANEIGISIGTAGGDFTIATVAADGQGATATIPTAGISTVQDLITAINGAGLGVTASWSNGRMTITPPAASSFAIVDDANVTVTTTTLGGVAVPAAQQQAVRGISNFFGLNDLLVSSQNGTSVTTDAWRQPTQSITNFQLDILSPAGPLAAYNSGAAAKSLETIANEINAAYGGAVTASIYRSGDGYAMRITGPHGAILSSSTHRVTNAPSSVADSIKLRNDIASDPTRISKGRVYFDADLGTHSLSAGDGSIMGQLAKSFSASTSFDKAGGLPQMKHTFSGYLSEIVGRAAAKASSAASSAVNQKSVSDALHSKISELSGVNIDEEMTQLMKLQNSYAASARVMNTVQEMLDALMAIGR